MTKRLFSNPRKTRNIQKEVIRTIQIRFSKQIQRLVWMGFDAFTNHRDLSNESVRELTGIISQTKII